MKKYRENPSEIIALNSTGIKKLVGVRLEKIIKIFAVWLTCDCKLNATHGYTSKICPEILIIRNPTVTSRYLDISIAKADFLQ